jgi:hypothetical protein
MLCGFACNAHSTIAAEQFSVIKSEIIPTSDVSLIRGRMTSLNPQKTIVFVDCDAVVFEHPIWGKMPEPFLIELATELRRQGIEGERYVNIIAAFLSAPKQPVDSELNRLIKELQDSGAIVVFLTSCPAGRVGEAIPSMATLRVGNLRDCGVPPQNWEGVTTLFDELGETSTQSIVPTDDTASVFVNGICFNIFSTKGKVMEAFLNRVKEDPTINTLISQRLAVDPSDPFANNLRNFRSFLQSGRQNELTVFFIDDSERNIHDLSRACGIYGTNYLGIHYTAQLEKYQLREFLVDMFHRLLCAPPGYDLVLPLFGFSSQFRGFLPSTAKTQLKTLVGQGLFLTPHDIRFLYSLTANRETIWNQ